MLQAEPLSFNVFTRPQYKGSIFMDRPQTLPKITLSVAIAVGVALLAINVVHAGIIRNQDSILQDGPVSVKHEGIYKLGELKIDPDDLHDLPSLPRNYQVLNNRGYHIHHTGVVAGPHIVRFVVKSVNDEKEFNELRIFHAHPDPYDPQSPAWEDVTELSSTKDRPNFIERTLVAKSNDLGVYVIAKLVGDRSKNPKADLAVSFSDVLDTVRSPEPIPFKISVLNKGPDVATNVGLRSSLPNARKSVLVDSSQGKCKELMGSVYCKLGSLKPDETATVSFVVTPEEGGGSFSEEGEVMATYAHAASDETDPNYDNNEADATTLALPNLNKAPSIQIKAPARGTVYVGPTDITIKATAEDPDGTISKVEFYDNGILIGSGTAENEKIFVITSNLSYGKHSFEAIATDNQGRQNRDFVSGILVNGPASIQITSPSNGASFSSTRTVKMTATVKHPTGGPMKVEFREVGGEVFGEGIRDSGDQYGFVWQNVREGMFVLIVIATDEAGVQTWSPPIRFTVVGRERLKR